MAALRNVDAYELAAAAAAAAAAAVAELVASGPCTPNDEGCKLDDIGRDWLRLLFPLLLLFVGLEEGMIEHDDDETFCFL